MDLTSLPEFPNIYAEAQAAGVLPNEALLENLINQARSRLNQPSIGEEEASRAGAKTQQNTRTEVYGNIDKLQEGGGYGEGRSPGAAQGTTMSGPMNATESMMMSALGTLMSGAPVNPASILGAASTLAGLLGVQREIDPTLANLDPQSFRDYFGAFAEADARTANAVNESMRGDISLGDTPEKAAGRAQEASDRAAKNDPTSTPENTSPIDATYGGPGGPGGPEGNTGGTGSPGGPGADDGSGMSLARGGIKKFKSKAKVSVAEREPETIIGIPQSFMKPGMKTPREVMMITALESLLAQLKGEDQ